MYSSEQIERNIQKEREILENTVLKFLENIIAVPVEFEIQYSPKKVWISNESSPYKNNGYYFNSRLGPIWKTPIVVITPQLNISDWIKCDKSEQYIITDLSNRGFGVTEKNLHYYRGMNGVTSNYLREMFQYFKTRWKSEFHPDFKFDYNDEQSQFLYNLNKSIKELSKGVFISSYVNADPICANPITVYFTILGRLSKKTQLTFEEIKKNFPNLNFNFVKTKQSEVLDLYWNDSDPKNWDKEKKEVERKKNEEFRISSFNNFKSDAIEKFGDIYDYYQDKFVDLKTSTKVHCRKHNLDFDVVPSEHLKGKRCPKDIESSGENMVRVFLESKKIPYLQYHKMTGCFSEKNGRCYLLTFDFYLPSKNLVIEYDGGQHFGPVSIFGGEESYQRTVMLDAIKNEFCKDNKIKMLRIPYTKTTEEAHKMMKKILGIK